MTGGADTPTFVFAFTQPGTDSVVAVVLSGIFDIAIKSSHLVIINRACSFPLLHFSGITQQFLKGWKVVTFLTIAATMVVSDNESVQNIWER